MGQLGDVLELFYGFAQPFQSVRATIRQWENVDLSEDASGEGREYGAASTAVVRFERSKARPPHDRSAKRRSRYGCASRRASELRNGRIFPWSLRWP